LSFGGFGALTRHLGRLTDALNDALSVEALTQVIKQNKATVHLHL